MLMPGNIVSGVAIKCPQWNHLHFELEQGDELNAADEALDDDE
jgi:hypothetical protein